MSHLYKPVDNVQKPVIATDNGLEQTLWIQLSPALTDIDTSADNAITIPMEKISALGAIFSSIPEAFRTATVNVSTPGLLQVTDQAGNLLDIRDLFTAKDGSGMIGSYLDSTKNLTQARFHEATQTVQSVTLPVNPSTLFMAAALSQIGDKLDAIQQTQKEMFDYMRQKDKAKLRGNLQTLADLWNTFRFNWDNDIWRNNSHMKVFDIKQDSETYIIHLRAQIKSKFEKKLLLENRFQVEETINKILDSLKECQMAVHIYSFAAFFEPLLSENLDAEYLNDVQGQIERQSGKYIELYEECLKSIDSRTQHAVDSTVLDGISFFIRTIGGAISRTPVGEHTPIDNVITYAGEDLRKFNERWNENIVEKLDEARPSDVSPFENSLQILDKLGNGHMTIAYDGNNMLFLPR